MVDIEKLLFAFAIEGRREILMAVTAVGSTAAASLPKIDPVIFNFIASLLISLCDIDFPHQSDMGFSAWWLGALVSIPIMIERGANHFHLRWHPLDRAHT